MHPVHVNIGAGGQSRDAYAKSAILFTSSTLPFDVTDRLGKFANFYPKFQPPRKHQSNHRAASSKFDALMLRQGLPFAAGWCANSIANWLGNSALLGYKKISNYPQ